MREQLISVLDGGQITLSEDEIAWMRFGMAKITVRTNSEEEFFAIRDKAIGNGLKVRVITDSGATEFHGVPTITALAIGPARSKEIDKVTGNLDLL